MDVKPLMVLWRSASEWTAPAMLEAQIVGSQPTWGAVPRDRWNASSYSHGGMFPQ